MGISDSTSNLAFVDVSDDYISQYLEYCCTKRHYLPAFWYCAGLAN